MKLISKTIAIVLSSFLFTSAFANLPAVNPATPATKINKPAAWQVSVVNNTYDSYTTYAAYLPSHIIWDTFLGAYGSSTDEIYYDNGVPNYCFNIVRNYDGLIVYFGCLQTGTVNINPYLANDKQATKDVKTAAAPVIKITQ